MMHIVLRPEITRSSTFEWLGFVTTYILVLFTHGYMTCGGFSQFNVGMSAQPRWDSLHGVNWVKIICYLSLFLMNRVPSHDKHNTI